MEPNFYAVIMAGGSGTRFWPKSRKTKPKQLLTIVGSKTMIRATVDRILPVVSSDHILVVSGVSCEDAVREQLSEFTHERITAEPEGRNTAPCIALAAYKIAKHDPDAVMAVLPADHVIAKEEVFRNALRTAYQAACRLDNLITFGIVPDRPETGYGYIERGEAAHFLETSTVFRVEKFVEKPDRKTAEDYLAQGSYFWNSGMFVWRVSSIIEAIETHLPSTAAIMRRFESALNTPDEPAALGEMYCALDSNSIDYGVLEKSAKVLVIPLDCGWNDVGAWSSLSGVWDGDSEGNAVDGFALCLNSSGCVVSSPHKLATLVGVEDLIVVDTQDALLVCRKSNAQDVKQLQDLLIEKGYRNLL